MLQTKTKVYVPLNNNKRVRLMLENDWCDKSVNDQIRFVDRGFFFVFCQRLSLNEFTRNFWSLLLVNQYKCDEVKLQNENA